MTNEIPDAGPAASITDKLALAWTHTARFLTTASQLVHLPATELPEIAFVGRSNAGKSTAINTLAQQKRLAFASKTPGRTQHINLFELGPKDAPDALFADLPGYGYAAVNKSAKLRWQKVMADYLEVRRVGLLAVELVGLGQQHQQLDLAGGDAALRATTEFLARMTTENSDVAVTLFSALKKTGVGDVALALHEWAHPTAAAVAV